MNFEKALSNQQQKTAIQTLFTCLVGPQIFIFVETPKDIEIHTRV
jgi:hypothetical protein